ncbi:MAG TPA: DsrE family protein [Caldimonas sp.]|nr:DsrE family protein [Caldimonas sp.]
MRRRLLALAAAAIGAAPALAADAKKVRVVVQVSDADPARWNLVLNNVANLQQDLGAANVEIEVVAYGPGLGMLKLDAVTNSRVADAAKSGVRIAACENTMRAQNVARADMHPAVAYVPAGVVEIVRRQQEGWAYLRP